jgi:hypothetical protein
MEYFDDNYFENELRGKIKTEDKSETKSEHGNSANIIDIKDRVLTEVYFLSAAIFYISTSLLNNLLQGNTEMILRFFNHELSHVLLGYNFLNEAYISDFDSFAKLGLKDRRDVQCDFLSTENTLKAISKNIELLTKPRELVVEKIKIEEFRVFKDLLYKWEHLYHYETEGKNLQLVIPMINLDDEKRPLIKTDKHLFEQIIYNILNNAIKYSHWGTKIRIDCRLTNYSYHKQIFSVVDYGAQIERGMKPYELYYRDVDILNVADGSGIGLFVVKRIANILGARIRHSCKYVSKYSIGLIEDYLQRECSHNNPQLRKDVLEEKLNLYSRFGMRIRRIISETSPDEDNKLSDSEIEKMITKPTWQVAFEVII